MARPTPEARTAYPYHHPTPTRWADNDVYGHVNNVIYYAYFDTAVNAYLAARGALDVQGGAVIGLVVETGCAFFAPATFPETLGVGVRVAHLGRSSVRYELAVFREGEDAACAQGHFVHVYVDRETRRPTELPAAFRAALEDLRVG
ncbi:thioesterase [Deinococcus aetherius]|uniref:Thioesterase n=1 Tax=Deinococcus aetherius TaxID=200252 RepID=A0ABN6RAK4_9DEIO|nr:thioesterase family protein [Deinococcus aetherius]BDP40390.1 thioesterase [Deinococcus aetherius]